MPAKPTLMAICGTRPEAVKLQSVMHALERRQHRTILVATGQHPDLAPRMFEELGIIPDIALTPARSGNEPAQLLAEMLTRLAPVIRAWQPAMVLVQGDTLSTLAGGLAAAYAQTAVAHIEAGLRTGDMAEPFPEEMHRRLVAPIAELHFAPTMPAARNLHAEGIDAERIRITGNSGIDSLAHSRSELEKDASIGQRLQQRFPFCDNGQHRTILATVHRRENIGPRLMAIADALRQLAHDDHTRIILPLHPNPAVRRPLLQQLSAEPHIHLVEPLDHREMVWLMQRAALLLTDSGGLQEEAPSFGLRTLVLRQVTERIEAVRTGIAELADFDSAAIVVAARRLLTTPAAAPMAIFGDGQAGERIAAHIINWLEQQAKIRPPQPPVAASAAENPESWWQSVRGHPA